MSQDIQANSFPCRECGVVYSEESGATNNFLCENCTADIKQGLKFRIVVETKGITYAQAMHKLGTITKQIERTGKFKVKRIEEKTFL